MSSRKSSKRRNLRTRLRFERLEDRRVLAAGLNVLAVQTGEVPENGSATMDISIDPAQFQFSSPGDEITLGFRLGPDGASELQAAPVKVVDDLGNPIRNLHPHTATDDPFTQAVLVDLSAGNYELVLDGIGQSYGQYELQILLAGDANGDLTVDRDDEVLIKSLFGARSSDAAYLSSADANLDGRIDGLDQSVARRNRGAAVLAIEALRFEVDPTLQPREADLDPFDAGGPRRPTAALTDKSGIQVDFVANELVVMSNDDQAVADLASRWNGTVVKVIDGKDYGVNELTKMHVLTIDADAADAEKLPMYLKQLDGNSRGVHKVSSEAGHKLLTVASKEAAETGMDIGVVWIGEQDTFRDRESNEAPAGPQNPDLTPYDQDAFTWTHLADGSNQDIATTEAWRALEIAGRLDNKVTAAVIDGGFTPNEDWPDGWRAVSLIPFDSPTNSSGSGDSPWHGQNVMSALAGIPDNEFGAAGSGGPVVDPIAIHANLDFVSWTAGVLTAHAMGADIINMSFGARVPATLSWSVIPFDLTTSLLRTFGTLLFAAAGNDGENVDAEDCFIVCWEEAWHTPVENGGVIGVGGLARDSLNKATNSNFGPEEVDIYAPYAVWVGPDNNNPINRAREVFGTSFSSPYVAGVAALIWAAEPRLSADEVEAILMGTARPSPDGNVNRVVNAYDAVIAVLGDVAPVIDIVTPVTGATFPHSTPVSLNASVDDVEEAITGVVWTSNLDGIVANGASTGTSSLSIGTHQLTATVTDAAGQTATDSVSITIVNPPPVMNILTPGDGDTLFVGQTVGLKATSFDVNGTSLSLSDGAIAWSSNLDGFLGTGHNVDTTLTAGTHVITVTGTDPQGSTGTDTIELTLIEPDNPLPVPVITQPSMDVTRFIEGFDESVGRFYIDITLTGTASDEGATLPDSSLAWTTSRGDLQDPNLGTGSSLTVRLYADSGFGGTHVITLTATDLSGQSVSTDVIVDIVGLA